MAAALSIIALLFALAAGCIVAGIYLLAGTAWALIAIGLLLFGAAVYLRSGMTPHA